MIRRVARNFALPRINFVGLRFSSNVHDRPEKNESFFEKHKRQILLAGGATGGVVTLYGISKILYTVTSTLFSLTPAASLYYGFLTGVITAGTGASAISSVYKVVNMNVDTAWRSAFYIINNDKKVLDLIGKSKLYGSDMIKAYKVYAGGPTVVNNMPTWVYPKAEMLVKLTGEKGNALASMKIIRKTIRGREQLEYLCLHIPIAGTNNTEDIVIINDDNTNNNNSNLKDKMLNSFAV